MDRKERLRSYFANVDEGKRIIAFDTIDEYLFFLDRIEELRKQPYIRVHPNAVPRQELITAANLICEYSQAVDAKRKTLLSILCCESSAAAGRNK